MLKKNDEVIAIVENILYPSTCSAKYKDNVIEIKGALPEQKLKLRITKARNKKKKATVLGVYEKAPYEVPSFCKHFGDCGGCQRQTVTYDKQLELKKTAVTELIKTTSLDLEIKDVLGSPKIYEYRNKMEYSFGDTEKGGELNLGMHRKGRNFDVVSVPNCKLIHKDFEKIRFTVENFARRSGFPKFNTRSLEGLWRNLIIRRGFYTGEILVGISVSSKMDFDEEALVESLCSLEIDGKIVGILKLINDAAAEVVRQGDRDKLIYGRDYYRENLLGVNFEVSFFSFFQTNTETAELLFEKALSKLSGLNDKVVYDLFCGVGTIGQIISKYADKVVGIDIVEDAIEKARKSAEKNGLSNCRFLAGDVFKVLNDEEVMANVPRPDLIILDPPRAGVSQKALKKIIEFGVSEILYISCNPKTMIENLVILAEAGYKTKNLDLVDLYPHTQHVEALALLSKPDVD